MSHSFQVIKQVMSVHRLTSGRCLVVGGETARVAEALGDGPLADRCRRLERFAEQYEDVRIRRRVQRQAKGDGRATEIDRQLDTVLRMMHGHLDGLRTALDGRALHDEAVAVFDKSFPEGLGAVVSVPYEDELIQVQRVFSVLKAQAPAVVDGLGLRWHHDEIDRLLPEYAEALAARRLVTAGDLAHARERMHAGLCAVVAYIVTHYFDDDQQEHLERLMAPVMEQQARLSALMRARRQGRSSATAAEDQASIDALTDDEAELDAMADAADADAADAAEPGAEAGPSLDPVPSSEGADAEG